MTTTLGDNDRLELLAVDLDGTLVRPGAPAWDSARQAWHLSVDQHPVAVVLAESARDIVAVVDTARALGLQVAAQATGHNAAPLGPLDDTILLKTSAMRGVQIDPVASVARVEAGAQWQDVTSAAAEYGLAALAGSAKDVGVVGYTLGGGLSWLGRSHGLAANSVVAIEVVTADGSHRRATAEHEADLFWALRGGGGSFGIVTAMEFRLFPVTEVHAGVLFFPVERAEEVLQAWRCWLPSLPNEVTSVGRILRFPPLPDLPPHLSGKSYVVVEAVFQLPAAEADALLTPLRALGPNLDTVCPTPVAALSALHMDPDGPVPAWGDGMLLDELPEHAVSEFVRSAEGAGRALLSTELRHLDGALRPGREGGGAVDGLAAGFALFAVGITPDAEAVRAVKAGTDAVHHAMAPWSTGRCYLNFAERSKSGAALFGEAVHRRLVEVKASYDPADLIRSNHPVTTVGAT
jgi:hypothetical protein